MAIDDDSTGKTLFAESPAADSVNPASASVQVDLGAITHPGFLRSTNEDHCLVVRFERSLKTVITNLAEGILPSSFDEVGYGMMVADGMGGAVAGEVASSNALCKFVELAVSTPDWIMKINRPEHFDTVAQRMATRFQAVDSALRKQGEQDISLRGMGTTLTLAVSLGADVLIGHIGDSRAYLFHDGELQQLTRDHTLAQSMIDAGLAQSEDKTLSAMRRVLTAALGSTGERKSAELQRVRLSHADQILLCSDGLTEMINETEIASVLRGSNNASESCQTLVDLALLAGGLDNITVVLAHYKFPSAN
jgi:protein phosphatase